MLFRSVHYRNRRADFVFVIGTSHEFTKTSAIVVHEGRFFTDAETWGARPVCVLGSQVSSNLFVNGESPLGKKVQIGRDSFEVVATLEPQGKFLGRFNMDNQVIIPIGSFMKTFTANPFISIQVKALNLGLLDQAKEELRGIMQIGRAHV